MGQNDHEQDYETDVNQTSRERQVTWPSDRRLPTIEEIMAAPTGLPTNPAPLFTLASSRREMAHTSQSPATYMEAGLIPRISVREVRNLH